MADSSYSNEYVVQVDESDYEPSENVKNRKVTFNFEYVEDPNLSPDKKASSY